MVASLDQDPEMQEPVIFALSYKAADLSNLFSITYEVKGLAEAGSVSEMFAIGNSLIQGL